MRRVGVQNGKGDSAMSTIILVTGVSSYFGRQMLDALARAGHTV
jgi:NAD(P)-dependent dehydrogenase (short-subunit alcohol dehydrogenase family)